VVKEEKEAEAKELASLEVTRSYRWIYRIGLVFHERGEANCKARNGFAAQKTRKKNPID